jgi:hypothetical protein
MLLYPNSSLVLHKNRSLHLEVLPTTLRYLAVRHGPLEEIIGNFSRFPNLTHLYNSRQQTKKHLRGEWSRRCWNLTTFPFFFVCPACRYLDNNRISLLPNTIFTSPESRIEHLDLSSNNITLIAPGAFNHAGQLRYLSVPRSIF